MRPKKLILLVDTNEERLALRRFLLSNKGFRVLSAATPEEAWAKHESCDLVVGAWPTSQKLVELARHYHVPSLLLVDKLTTNEPLHLHVTQVLSGPGNTAPWAIVESVKYLSASKRGPKPVLPVTVERRLEVLKKGVA